MRLVDTMFYILQAHTLYLFSSLSSPSLPFSLSPTPSSSLLHPLLLSPSLSLSQRETCEMDRARAVLGGPVAETSVREEMLFPSCSIFSPSFFFTVLSRTCFLTFFIFYSRSFFFLPSFFLVSPFFLTLFFSFCSPLLFLSRCL